MNQKKSQIDPEPEGANEVWIAGGPLWVNFANSWVLATKGRPDIAGSPESLQWWLSTMGLQAPSRIGSADLKVVSNLRESVYRIIDSIDRGGMLGTEDLEQVNAILRKQNNWFELNQRNDGAILKKEFRSIDTIEQALGPIVESLADTLAHGELARLRTCAHPDCILKFYDDSKNGTRRWCTMSGCGNRAKAAAYLQRKKANGESL